MLYVCESVLFIVFCMCVLYVVHSVFCMLVGVCFVC